MSHMLKKYRVNAVVSFKNAHKSPKGRNPSPQPPHPHPPKSPKVSKKTSTSSEAVATSVVETLVDRGRVRGGRDRRIDSNSANRADRFQLRLNALETEVTNLKRVEENLERRLHVFVKHAHGLTSTTDDYHNRLESLARSCKALSNGK